MLVGVEKKMTIEDKRWEKYSQTKFMAGGDED